MKGLMAIITQKKIPQRINFISTHIFFPTESIRNTLVDQPQLTTMDKEGAFGEFH